MRKYKDVFKRFIDFENLYNGYLLACKGKRYKTEVMDYSQHLEENLINSQNHLIHHTYKVKEMREFIEYEPKKRVITVMPFENRVVNCAAYLVLFPIYQRMFYEHSYGSIPGKGALKAVEKLQQWLQLVSNKPEKWYLCKMDVTKFFFRIPYEVQMECLSEPLDDPDMIWFLERAIKCDGRAFGIPTDAKDVSHCERVPGIGMQVGSLISQLTANVVLNKADQYIKRVLKVPYYLRYMDDMIFLAPSKEKAEQILAAMESFLYDNLGLELNKKTFIQPASKPVEFVGRIVSKDKIRIRKATSLRMKRNLKRIRKEYAKGNIDSKQAFTVLTSYRGIMKHASCTSLSKKLHKDFVLVRDDKARIKCNNLERHKYDKLRF